MGTCGSTNSKAGGATSSPEEKKVNAAIENELNAERDRQLPIKKLLLLGTGESGKSTFFKQIQDIYGGGLRPEDVEDHFVAVHTNTLQSMQTLCANSPLVADMGFPMCRMDPGLAPYAKLITDEANLGSMLNGSSVEAIERLWADPGIKATFQKRAYFQLPVSNPDYFFERVRGYIEPNWTPAKQDMLHCRVRTTGIQECLMTQQNFQIKLVDVGGQRSERKKWLNCFDSVDAILFLTAVSEYDQQLFEDISVNRIVESLNVFEDLMQNQLFTNCSIILFLNKRDLFQEKIATVQISKFFPDFPGPEGDFDEGIRFFAGKFQALNRHPNKEIYVHVTCATDDDSVKFVFNAVKDIVINKAVAEIGM